MPISEATVFKNYKHASARRLKIVKTFYSRRAELLISEVVNLFLFNLVFANLSPHTTPNGIKYMLYMVNKALSTDRRIRYIQLLRAFSRYRKYKKSGQKLGIPATDKFGQLIYLGSMFKQHSFCLDFSNLLLQRYVKLFQHYIF